VLFGALPGGRIRERAGSAYRGGVHTIPLALSEQQVSPGTLGFVVVALLGVALFFLIRSMNKQMKKINFDDGSEKAAPPGAESAKAAAAPAKPDDAKPADG
jgi:hypothetical protein